MVLDYKFLIQYLGLKKAKLVGKNLMSLCPFPEHKDTNPSFGINIYSGYWNCFSCGQRGRNIESLFIKLGKEIPDKIKLFSKEKGKEINNNIELEFELKDWYLDIISENVELAYKLLRKRGLSLEILKKFKVGAIGEKIRFPIFDKDKNFVGWIERSDKWSYRYRLRPKGLKKMNYLYGIDKVKEGKGLFVVEGTIDALKIWQWGYQAVATLGSYISEIQAKQILDVADRVFFLGDNDKAGRKFFDVFINRLYGKIKIYYVKYPNWYSDVGDTAFTKKHLLFFIKNKHLYIKNN